MLETLTTLRTQLASLAADFEPATLSGPNAVKVASELATMQRLLGGMLAATARRVHDTSAHAATADRSGAGLVARLCGVPESVMQRSVRLAEQLDTLPATRDAVRHGKLSILEAELVADAASVHPSSELQLLAKVGEGLAKLKDACERVKVLGETGPARRQRQSTSRTLRTWKGRDGMFRGTFAMQPEVAGQFQANIDRAVNAIFRSRRSGELHEPHDRYALDALVAYVCSSNANASANASAANEGSASAARADGHSDGDSGTRSADGPTQRESSTQSDFRAEPPQPMQHEEGSQEATPLKPSVPLPPTVNAQVNILIDHAALVRGEVREGELCEIPGVGPVDVSWVRSLLGSAFVAAVIRKGKDIATVAHLGRHIPAEIRTALTVMGRECSVQGCECRNYLEIDHTEEFAKGGVTKLSNLDWLCPYHHDLKTTKSYKLGPKDPETGKRKLHPPPRANAA